MIFRKVLITNSGDSIAQWGKVRISKVMNGRVKPTISFWRILWNVEKNHIPRFAIYII